MAHFRRKKTRRQVKCTLCTDVRWRGNSSNRIKGRPKRHTNARQNAGDDKTDMDR